MMSVGDEFWIMVLPLSQINNVDLRVSMENLVIWKVMKLEQTVIRMIRLLTLLLACAGDTELTFSFRIKMKEAKKISMRLPWWSKLIVCANGACGSCYTTRESNNSLKGWKRMSARTSTAKTWYISSLRKIFIMHRGHFPGIMWQIFPLGGPQMMFWLVEKWERCFKVAV